MPSANCNFPAARRGACGIQPQAACPEAGLRARARIRPLAAQPKGQAAPEFLLFVSFFILLFIILSALFYRQQADELSQKESLIARELAQQYADTANFALRAGDTFFGRFHFQKDVLGRSYNLSFANGTSGYVYLSWLADDGSFQGYSSPLSTGSMQIDPSSCISCFGQDIDGAPGGPQLLTLNATGNITYRNQGGVLYIGNQ